MGIAWLSAIVILVRQHNVLARIALLSFMKFDVFSAPAWVLLLCVRARAKSEFFFVAGLPKAGTTSLVTWMTEALGLPSTLKEPGFLYDCPRSVSCFRGGRLTARQVRFGDLPFDVECVVDGSPHYLHSQHFP